MKIIDYSSKYNEDIKGLLVELQEYIAKIDREKYFEKTMNELNKYEGKMFLAIEKEKIIG